MRKKGRLRVTLATLRVHECTIAEADCILDDAVVALYDNGFGSGRGRAGYLARFLHPLQACQRQRAASCSAARTALAGVP